MPRPAATPVQHLDEGRIRATEWKFTPGAETGWHIHGHDYTVIPLTGGELLIEMPDGSSFTAPLNQHIPYARQAGVEHNVINNGDAPLSFLEVEIVENPMQEKRLQCLSRFADAWNARDVDALMACMAEECEFKASAGPDTDGKSHKGRDAVRLAYQAIFDRFPKSQWSNPAHTVSGDTGVSHWRFVGEDTGGNPIDVLGCDLFRFDGEFIALKDSYRKSR